MKIIKCRSCKNKSLKKTLSLGVQKLTGIFPSSNKENVPEGDLSLVFCEKCKLLQLENSFDPSKMYGDNYGYMSSLNSSMVDHLKKKAEKLKKLKPLSSGDIVCDIGSNDGTFLSFFSNNLILMGIDPTIKKLSKFYRKDIIKIADFFSTYTVQKITNKKIKLITSVSMFYDLEDPIKFSNEVYELLDDDGIWHIELSYMPMMIKNTSYDTICHEHLEYYSLLSIKYILDASSFKIIDLEFNDINGGSFSITVAKKKSKQQESGNIVDWLLKKEDLFNYNKLSTFKIFSQNIKRHKKIFVELLLDLKASNKKVLGYGASTKGNVILQYCNINRDLLPYIYDINPYKYEKFTPGSNIKIISEKKSRLQKPDYFLVLPWHFKNNIIEKEKFFLKNGGKLIFPMPDIEII
jgi:hypothetical protein